VLSFLFQLKTTLNIHLHHCALPLYPVINDSNSNQETFRVELQGRLVFDVLRQVRIQAC